MKDLHKPSFVLVCVGALNWGLIGLLNFNLVSMIFGEGTMLTKLVYILVGAAAVYELTTHAKNCKACATQ